MCNCSGSHQGTKTERIDMSFTPLSEKPARHRSGEAGGAELWILKLIT